MRRTLTNRERWLAAVCDLRTDGTPVGIDGKAGAPRQSGAFRLVMTLLAMYADHDTGANARPSMRLLQDLSHYKHSTVRAALDVAQEAGYITASGTWTPTKGGDPITVWALGYPTAEGFVPWGVIEDESASSGPSTDPVEEVGGAAGRSHRSPESVVPLDGTTDTTVGGAAGRNHRTDPVEEVGGAAGRNVGGAAGRNVGGAAGRHTTSSTSRPLGREEEEEESRTPAAPDGAAAPAPIVGYLEAVQALEAQLRQQWPERFSFRITGKTRSALRALLDNGWTLEQLLTLTAEVPEPKSNPAGLLQKHYARALDDADPADYTPVVHADDAPTSQATATARGGECDHGVPRGHQCRDCEDESAHEMFGILDRAKALGLYHSKETRNGEVIHHITGSGSAYGVNFIYDEDGEHWVQMNAWWLGGADDLQRALPGVTVEESDLGTGMAHIPGPLEMHDIVGYLAPLVEALGKRWAEDKRAKAKYGIAY